MKVSSFSLYYTLSFSGLKFSKYNVGGEERGNHETLTMHIENWMWKGLLVLRNDRPSPRAGVEMASGDFWTVVLEKTCESPLGCKEIQPVHHKVYQSWVFIARTDAEAETPILWLPYVKNWLTGKDPDAGKDWRKEEKGMTEDEMVGWHHWLNGHEFEQVLGDGVGQGSLVCCSLWSCKRSDITKQPNNNSHYKEKWGDSLKN